MTRKTLIVGNWKMHKQVSETIKLITELKSKIPTSVEADVAVAPPFTSLSSAEIALQDSGIRLAAQNAYFEEQGAFTGEVSMGMLKDVGCEFVIVGHSERRHIFHETDETIHKKLLAALQVELTPIFCIGETLEERKNEQAFSIVEDQIKKGIVDIDLNEVSQIVFAYEPVWAIGTGETATPAQAQEMHQFIRNTLSKVCDKPTANTVRILYGGSVKPDNARTLLRQPDIDGLLVGGASLLSSDFSEIVQSGNGN